MTEKRNWYRVNWAETDNITWANNNKKQLEQSGYEARVQRFNYTYHVFVKIK